MHLIRCVCFHVALIEVLVMSSFIIVEFFASCHNLYDCITIFLQFHLEKLPFISASAQRDIQILQYCSSLARVGSIILLLPYCMRYVLPLCKDVEVNSSLKFSCSFI